MKLSKTSEIIYRVAHFRNLMGGKLSYQKIAQVWGEAAAQTFRTEYREVAQIGNIVERDRSPSPVEEKLKYAERLLPKLLLFNWVKFIAVSGSVAAQIAKDGDDIDLFILVKDHRMWIYRLWLKLFRHRYVLNLSSHSGKNKLCINFICEERGVRMEHHDIFVLHELLYMKPLYNKVYLKRIYYENQWMAKLFKIKPTEGKALTAAHSSLLFEPLNLLCAVLQICFMMVSGHRPRLSQLIRSYRAGQIIFYPAMFRDQKLKEFKEGYVGQ